MFLILIPYCTLSASYTHLLIVFVGAYEITGVDKSDVHNDFIFAHTAELDGS